LFPFNIIVLRIFWKLRYYGINYYLLKVWFSVCFWNCLKQIVNFKNKFTILKLEKLCGGRKLAYMWYAFDEE